MAIGERIHYFRLLRGFTQKYLGKLLGFSDSQADVRIAQYEKGARSPKEKYLNALAQIFNRKTGRRTLPPTGQRHRNDLPQYVGYV